MHRRSRWVALVFCAAAFLFGAVGLAGWILDQPQWRSLWTSGSQIKCNTALAMLLLASAIALRTTRSRPRAARLISFVASAATILIASLTLAQYASGASFGIDQLLFRDTSLVGTSSPGRMAAPTALALLFGSVALLLLDWEIRQSVRPAQWLALAMAFVPSHILMSYAYGNMNVLAVGSRSSYMAVPTALAFISLAGAILLYEPRRGLMETLTADTHASAVFRWLLVALVFVPPALGWYVLKVLGGSYQPAEFGVSTTIMLCITVLAALAWLNAARLNRAEEELRERQEQLRFVTNNAPVLIVHCDAQGRYRFVNEPYAERFGLQSEQIMGKRIADVVGTASYESVRQHVEAALRGQRVEFEDEIPYETGRRWMHCVYVPQTESDGTVNGFVAVIQDTTERKIAEEALREREAVLRTVTTEAQVGLVMVNRERRYVFANQTYADILGLKDGNILGKRVAEVIPELYDQIAPRLDRAFAGERVTYELHQPAHPRTHDGRFYEVVYAPRTQKTADPYVVVVIVDITQRKRTEEVLQQAKLEAEEANRAKDQFLAMLSHELRTPLTPVLMTVSALRRQPEINGALGPDLEMIQRNVELEALLIDDLLDLTRIAHGKFELHEQPVDIHAAIEHALGISVAELNGKRLQLIRHFGASEHHCRADAARLQQVFWNLITNAVKFTPAGGELRVTTRNDDQNQIVIQFADTGIGIDPELQPRIFDAFEQGGPFVTTRFGGLGLGLAISKRVIDMHGGTIAVQSAGRDAGTTFTITLKAVETSLLQKPQYPVMESASPKPGAEILLVEDHQDTARVLCRMLENAGYHATHAANMQEARASAAARHFNLLISDLGLPDGNGLQLMRELRNSQGISGIAVTGFGMENDVAAAKEAGFSEHFTKPIDWDRLRQTVDRLVQQDSRDGITAPS